MQNYNIQNRNVALCIILTFLTCGFYFYYWYYTVALAIDSEPTVNRAPTTAGVSLLLFIVTGGIYGVYLAYVWGKALPEMYAFRGRFEEDKSILFLILSLFALSIINLAVIQSSLNELSTPNYSA